MIIKTIVTRSLRANWQVSLSRGDRLKTWSFDVFFFITARPVIELLLKRDSFYIPFTMDVESFKTRVMTDNTLAM
jgi:hypothetical protein